MARYIFYYDYVDPIDEMFDSSHRFVICANSYEEAEEIFWNNHQPAFAYFITKTESL